jgi:hypothetical protein
LAWARRAISSSYALETGSEGFGIGEKVAHDCVDRPDDAAFIECIISWSSLPAAPFCRITGTIRSPRSAASMAMLVPILLLR